ncbi:MAG: S-layer homology domain-containing protein [Oscillospiraceae bacterium]|nr:S-layer homology domain-containing protein [Oscillospiraceae bacterium]
MNRKIVYLILSAAILFTSVFVPTSVSLASSVVQAYTPVAGGSAHTIALKNDGTIWTWGTNRRMQLGWDSGTEGWPTPTQVDENISTISVAAGIDFSIALWYDGNVYVLGTGGNSPVYLVPRLTGIVAVAAGQNDGLALDRDGKVWQWTIGETPREVQRLNNIAAIAAGGSHFFALTFSGEVWAWGDNWNGQLGDGTFTNAEQPKRIDSLANIIYITAGNTHSLAVANDGSVYSWGNNDNGQLGDGTKETRNSPIKIEGITNAAQVSASANSSMVLTDDNKIYTWGNGEYGELGDGSISSEFTPKEIEIEGKPIFIASGLNHNFYVTDNGDLYAWGRNNSNQLGIDSERNINQNQPVKVAEGLSVAENGAKLYDIYTNPLNGVSNWAKNELPNLYKMNVLPPMMWGRYQENVTRAEFAGLLVNTYEAIQKKNITIPNYTNFTDIENHVYETEIRKAFEIELVLGVSDTSFNPQGRITRQEAAKMICTFVAIMEDFPPPSDVTSLAYYNDANKIAQWAVPFVAFAHDNDIMQGKENGLFDPLSNLTCEQTLAMLYRTIINPKYNWVSQD